MLAADYTFKVNSTLKRGRKRQKDNDWTRIQY